jgi:ABC-type ATPase involved in cell division
MIELSGVTKRYPGGHEALSDVSLTIEQGELVFLTGHSGAGKSTLLKLVAAIERPTVGHVIVNSQNVGRMKRPALPFFRRNIGLIFQDHKLLYDRNVFDNVLLPLHIQGLTGNDAAKRVRAALDKVGLLKKERPSPSPSPAASSNACASPAPSSAARPWCWRTNPPPTWTTPTPRTSWTCSGPSTKWASPCSSPPTTRT